MKLLLCPVRDCRLLLLQTERTYRCEKQHSFDIARSGYVNLLQPQDKKSKTPGDSKAAVLARRRLHDLGITRPLLEGFANMLSLTVSDVVLDAGCGDGFYLGSLAAMSGCSAHGIDISVPAIDAASRRYPSCEWIVANADRFIPYQDASFNKVVSITARMNPSEFRRVLRDDGQLLIAVPAPDDLIELRGQGRDRAERTISDFSKYFELTRQQRLTTTADLPAEAVEDILVSIYRPIQKQSFGAMRVTFSLDVLLFRPAIS